MADAEEFKQKFDKMEAEKTTQIERNQGLILKIQREQEERTEEEWERGGGGAPAVIPKEDDDEDDLAL